MRRPLYSRTFDRQDEHLSAVGDEIFRHRMRALTAFGSGLAESEACPNGFRRDAHESSMRLELKDLGMPVARRREELANLAHREVAARQSWNFSGIGR
jgi:hypothetical protein